jgi:hypothetical protein
VISFTVFRYIPGILTALVLKTFKQKEMELDIIKKIKDNRRKTIILSGRLNGLGITGFIVVRNNEGSKQVMVVSKSIPDVKKTSKAPESYKSLGKELT